MRLFELGLIASPAQQKPRAPEPMVAAWEPPPAPAPFLETEPAVMPYAPTNFDLAL